MSPELRTACLLLVLASVPLTAQDSGWRVPRTPWGDPDLQGVWPSTEYVSVPLQRSPDLGLRNELTDGEVRARHERELAQKDGFERNGAGGATGAPGHWLEWGTTQRQASLIVDPPDGRMPTMTPEATERLARQPRGTMGTDPLDTPADFTMWERCLTRGVLGSTLPVLYNSGIDITQGPGFVAIRYEMVHDHRVIPLDRRPRPPATVTSYMGEARGHWEGDTLVVETTNFNGRVGPGISGGGVPNTPDMRLTERFTRVSHDVIRYEATVEDPQTWTAPWTVAFDLTLMPDYAMHEYACHEGNLGLRNALSGSRADDAAGVSPAR